MSKRNSREAKAARRLARQSKPHEIEYDADADECPRCGAEWYDGNHHRREHRWVCCAPEAAVQ